MANIITAGNSTNGGTAITTDTSGTLNIVTGSGSGATAVTVDGSGNMVVTGTLTASNGITGSIARGTAVASTSGTSIDFTSIPSGVKRITVMFQGVSTNSTNPIQVQIGSGSYTVSGYISTGARIAGTTSSASSTVGFMVNTAPAATEINSGIFTLTNITSNSWVASFSGKSSTTLCLVAGGDVSLSGALDRLRIVGSTTGSPTDTFDAGSINILYE